MATHTRDDMDLETNGGITDTGSSMAGTARDVAASVADAGRQLKDHAPEMMATSRGAIDEANRRLQGEPDEALWIGGTFSVGLGVGLFVAGAPRLLVLLAIAPALAIAGTLLGRQGSPTGLGI